MASRTLAGSVRGVARRVAARAGLIEAGKGSGTLAIQRYLAGGRVPWSDGYSAYKRQRIAEVLADAGLMRRFARLDPLPDGYGARLDERIVEYPWVLARLGEGGGKLLDAGSTLNYPDLLSHPTLAQKQIVVVTLSPAHVEKRATISYLYDDLRDLILRDAVFDVVTCISTLEHIGLDNARLYSENARYAEHDLQGYAPALAEMRRVLKPGGRLLLTIPYGRAEEHGWLQQFDAAGIQRLLRAFGGETVTESYYAYSASGWQQSSADACADARYYDVHADPKPQPDGAAAARAVCCLELRKP